MHVVALIPARYASTRFPAKPLVELLGQSMLERVWRAASTARSIHEVYVCTDDERIVAECQRIGARCIMTSPDLPSGTDRVAAAASQLETVADIVLNVQGDEPLLQSSLLDSLVEALRSSDADVATPIHRINSEEELDNPTICKVALRSDYTALYFSRSVIPHTRDVYGTARLSAFEYWKHIGIYAYRANALQRFVNLTQHPLECAESLEQLRLLADGARYLCVPTTHHLVAVDTPADAERVRALLQSTL